MTTSFTLTVSGWITNTSTLELLLATDDVTHVDVLELFGVEFWRDYQRLALAPQKLLILVTPQILANPFALGFLQYYRVTAELSSFQKLLPQSDALVPEFRRKVLAMENNWAEPTLKGRVRPDLIKLNQRLAGLRQAFAAGTMPFSQYQQAEWTAVNAVSTHLAAHLAGVQHHQRQLWGTLQAKVAHQALRQPLLANGRGNIEWAGPTTLTTVTIGQAITFVRTSKLPTVHRAQLRDPTYRDTLLAPLRRGHADWVRAGRPLDPPAELPVGLKAAFKSWQDFQTSNAS